MGGSTVAVGSVVAVLVAGGSCMVALPAVGCGVISVASGLAVGSVVADASLGVDEAEMMTLDAAADGATSALLPAASSSAAHAARIASSKKNSAPEKNLFFRRTIHAATSVCCRLGGSAPLIAEFSHLEEEEKEEAQG